MELQLTVIANIKALQHTNTMNAWLQYMGTLCPQRIAAQVQMESSRGLVASQTEQQIF